MARAVHRSLKRLLQMAQTLVSNGETVRVGRTVIGIVGEIVRVLGVAGKIQAGRHPIAEELIKMRIGEGETWLMTTQGQIAADGATTMTQLRLHGQSRK